MKKPEKFTSIQQIVDYAVPLTLKQGECSMAITEDGSGPQCVYANSISDQHCLMGFLANFGEGLSISSQPYPILIHTFSVETVNDPVFMDCLSSLQSAHDIISRLKLTGDAFRESFLIELSTVQRRFEKSGHEFVTRQEWWEHDR